MAPGAQSQSSKEATERPDIRAPVARVAATVSGSGLLPGGMAVSIPQPVAPVVVATPRVAPAVLQAPVVQVPDLPAVQEVSAKTHLSVLATGPSYIYSDFVGVGEANRDFNIGILDCSFWEGFSVPDGDPIFDLPSLSARLKSYGFRVTHPWRDDPAIRIYSSMSVANFRELPRQPWPRSFHFLSYKNGTILGHKAPPSGRCTATRSLW
jgi:hypothetical protein